MVLLAVNYFLTGSILALSFRNYPRRLRHICYTASLFVFAVLQTAIAESNFIFEYSEKGMHISLKPLEAGAIICYFHLAASGIIYNFMVCRSLLKPKASERFLLLKPIGLILT